MKVRAEYNNGDIQYHNLSEDMLVAMFVEAAGGGYTVPQTVDAMAMSHRFYRGEPVKLGTGATIQMVENDNV